MMMMMIEERLLAEDETLPHVPANLLAYLAQILEIFYCELSCALKQLWFATCLLQLGIEYAKILCYINLPLRPSDLCVMKM